MQRSAEQDGQRQGDEQPLPPPLGREEKFALTGIVLGLASLVLWLILPMGLVLGVPALIVSYLGRRSKKRNLAYVGMLTAALGIAGSLTLLAILIYLSFAQSP